MIRRDLAREVFRQVPPSSLTMRAASLILTAWVVLAPVGCQVWKAIPVTPLAATEIEENPRLVRLTLDDGRVVTLQSPRIEKDSIYGLAD
jgi:type III secretory pathway component EscR